MIMMILISPVMIDVDDGDALFTDKDKDGDECERPPKTQLRRKKRRTVMMVMMINVADGDALFTDKDKAGDECEGPPKTHKRRKKSNHARKPHDSTGNQKV